MCALLKYLHGLFRQLAHSANRFYLTTYKFSHDSNTLKLRVSDVLDTSSSNWMSAEGFGNGTSSESGWANRITTYDAFSQMYVKGTSNDTLNLQTGDWTKQGVTDAFAYNTYITNYIDIYLASNGAPAMLAVSKAIVVTVGPGP